MEISVDTASVAKLEAAMGRYGQIMPTQKANSALRKAARPMLQRARQEAPSSGIGEYVPLSKKGSTANAYRRGGSMRRDLRIKSVNPERNEIGRVLVGVSKKSTAVGWRTPFITKGTVERKTRKGAYRGSIRANNFLQKAYNITMPIVSENFKKEYSQEFIKWAKNNLPQDRL